MCFVEFNRLFVLLIVLEVYSGSEIEILMDYNKLRDDIEISSGFDNMFEV